MSLSGGLALLSVSSKEQDEVMAGTSDSFLFILFRFFVMYPI